jgi:uncharacterized protein YqeY
MAHWAMAGEEGDSSDGSPIIDLRNSDSQTDTQVTTSTEFLDDVFNGRNSESSEEVVMVEDDEEGAEDPTVNYLMELRNDLSECENEAVNEVYAWLPKQTDELLMIVMKTVRQFGADNPDEEDPQAIIGACLALLSENVEFQRAANEATEQPRQENMKATSSSAMPASAPSSLPSSPSSSTPTVPPSSSSLSHVQDLTSTGTVDLSAAEGSSASAVKTSWGSKASPSSSFSSASETVKTPKVVVSKTLTPTESVLDVFPDAEDSFVGGLLKKYNNNVELAIQHMAENGYEKRTVRAKVVAAAEKDFSSSSWETSSNYRSLAVLQLQFDFPFIRVTCIKELFADCKHHYWHALNKIETDLGVKAGQFTYSKGGFSAVTHAEIADTMMKAGIQAKAVVKSRYWSSRVMSCFLTLVYSGTPVNVSDPILLEVRLLCC